MVDGGAFIFSGISTDAGIFIEYLLQIQLEDTNMFMDPHARHDALYCICKVLIPQLSIDPIVRFQVENDPGRRQA